MSTSITWNDIVNKLKGVTIGTRSVSQSITKDYWLSGDNTFLTRIDVDATGVYNNGYNSGRTQGQNDVKNSPNSYGLYTKSQYDTNYNNGYNSGTNNGVPNQCGVQYWSRDNESSQSWSCTSTGWYVIFVYGMVNANGRYETPNVSVSNGAWKNGHDVNTSTNNRIHAWLYYINSGGSVSCSWSVHRGTYQWRNGFLIIKVR